MDLNFGINAKLGVKASRPISISSSTPIAIVATGNDNKLIKFNSASKGLEYLKEAKINKGTLYEALIGINLQGVNSPIVVSLAKADRDKKIEIKNILQAVEELKKSDPITGIDLKNAIIIAPRYSANAEVATKIDSIASKLWAIGIVDDFSSNEADVSKFVSNFSSKYLLIGTGEFNANGISIPFSPLYAGLIALYDAKTSYGWAKSHSNRVVRGVSGTKRVIEYLDGNDCEARRLRQKSVAMIVKDIGWRSYGFETTHIDPIWQSLERVRTFHKLLTAIIKANKWARDREADQLMWVKNSITDFLNELIGKGVVIGFDVLFDPLKNTKATVTAGKFYLTILAADMPSIKELNIEFIYSDKWGKTLINYINK